MSLSIIILAAGKGKRMFSEQPKVLHQLAGKPLLEHVYDTALNLDHHQIHIVYGHGGDEVQQTLAHCEANWVCQAEQLGTAHAVQQAIPTIPDEDTVLILYGDVPLITKETLQTLVNAALHSDIALLTAYVENPKGYGRIIRNDLDQVTEIVEEKDTNDEQRRICEINSGFMAVKCHQLKKWLANVNNTNSQQEYYLTDIVAMAVAEGISVESVLADSSMEVQGINNRVQLAEAERYYQIVQAHHLMQSGVGLIDPSRFDLRGELEVGVDTLFDINVIIEGKVLIGNNVHIGSNCIIKNSTIADNVKILSNTVIENAVIGNGCRIGPFARIRPDTALANDVHIGNFVEIKKTSIGTGSKVNHLSYIGDSHIGEQTNIGAGAITCNYDGANKHVTTIGDNVFVGSDVQLIAPVNIEAGATIAAGTTISKDVTANSLAITRPQQREIPNWQRPQKKTT